MEVTEWWLEQKKILLFWRLEYIRQLCLMHIQTNGQGL
jgi:hypothetical protein